MAIRANLRTHFRHLSDLPLVALLGLLVLNILANAIARAVASGAVGGATVFFLFFVVASFLFLLSSLMFFYMFLLFMFVAFAVVASSRKSKQQDESKGPNRSEGCQDKARRQVSRRGPKDPTGSKDVKAKFFSWQRACRVRTQQARKMPGQSSKASSQKGAKDVRRHVARRGPKDPTGPKDVEAQLEGKQPEKQAAGREQRTQQARRM